MPARPVPFTSNMVAEILGAASALLGMLSEPFMRAHGGPGGWLLLFAPELHLIGGEVLVPELAGWRRDRLPELPDVTVMTLTPDWVCEVLSSETVAQDRGSKMLAYAHVGVKHVWLVDPDLRTLEVYSYEDDAWSLLGVHEESQRVHAEPFEALGLELNALWRR